jgi:hypothetical protein
VVPEVSEVDGSELTRLLAAVSPLLAAAAQTWPDLKL